jgi:hypothetical protein
MKVASYVMLGAVAGFAATLACAYLFGFVAQAFGLQLYHSEADQQRNFNIVLAIALVFFLLGGRFGYKAGKRRHQELGGALEQSPHDPLRGNDRRSG